MAKQKRRLNSEVNAGSMADIAFLLLIFFLVTTQIDFDKGILVKLPAWDESIPETPISNRNVFSIKVNRENKLLVEGELGTIDAIRNQVKEFVLNPLKKSNLSSAPNKAVVSLQNDRGTSYKTYLSVYNEVKAAYNELWKRKPIVDMEKFSQHYQKLPKKKFGKKFLPSFQNLSRRIFNFDNLSFSKKYL